MRLRAEKLSQGYPFKKNAELEMEPRSAKFQNVGTDQADLLPPGQGVPTLDLWQGVLPSQGFGTPDTCLGKSA